MSVGLTSFSAISLEFLSEKYSSELVSIRCSRATASDLASLTVSESSFVKNIKFKLSQKVSQSFLESLQNIKLFPIFVSKNLYNPPKNIFLVGDAFFAFSPSFAQGASQSIEGANELYECLINNNNFYDIRLKRVKMINSRSNFNQFAFHLSNPIMIIFRNIFLKLLTKNKKFLESYLGKIYKS